MNKNYQFYFRVNFKCLFKRNRIHIPCITFCFIYIFASRSDPVFLKRIIYPLLLVTCMVGEDSQTLFSNLQMFFSG